MPSAVAVRLALLCPLIALATVTTRADDLQQALSVLQQASQDGRDHREVTRAWQVVAHADARRLPAVLAAIDGATPLGANWLRSAVDAAAGRQLDHQADLPREAMEAFILDRQHDPRARYLAYRWLVRFDETARERLLAQMANDPSVELRREAVDRLIRQAKTIDVQRQREEAIEAYRSALHAARDQDQVKQIAAALKKLGQTVDLPRHFGFITQWKLIAPFDNSDRKGFDAVYPPERELNARGVYKGKTGSVKWQPLETDHPFGMVDFNKPYGKLKEVVGYAWADFRSEREQQVELRLGCKNAWKLWLNGEFIFGRDEYHRGMQMDQYRYRVTLRPGVNRILLKICQNEQQEDWTVQWEFQLRVCDATGTAILSADRDGSS